MTTLCQDTLQEKELMYTIYKYTNKENNKVYIGRTSKTLAERAQKNGSNYKSCRRFYQAIQEYSWESFVPEILETVDTLEEANKLEAYYINQYKSNDEEYGYNLEDGGDCGPTHTETKQLISKSAKERYSDGVSNPMYGRKHTEEALAKQSACKIGEKNPMYGRKWNETQRQNCSTKGKHLNLTDEQRKALSERAKVIGYKNAKSIRCVTDGREFKSSTQAAEYYGIPISCITDNLNGRSATCHKMVFERIVS